MKNPIKRTKTGQFDKGHKSHPKAGRPKGSKADKVVSIAEQVEKQKKAWRKQARAMLGEVLPFCETLISTSGDLLEAMLRIKEKGDLSSNDVDRLNKLSTSIRLNVSEMARVCHRESKRRRDEELFNKKHRRRSIGVY
jgi:hypothetical protein